jgi:thiosulfate reductase cytochrome b subunit
MAESKKVYFYPVWLRMWHGINAIGIIILIITGISMQSMEWSFIGFNSAISFHNIAGAIITISYFIFFIGNLITTNGTFYRVKPKGLIKRPMKQAQYYIWGMFHGKKAPYPLSEKRKFNPLQKYSYIIVMYLLVPMVIISGIALLYPEIILENVYQYSGIFVTAIFHSILGFFISIFLVVHVYIASIGKSPKENFISIISGWHHV